MDYKDHSLADDIKDVFNNGSKASKNVTYNGVLKVGSKQFKIGFLDFVTIERNYITNFTERINIKFDYPIGDFVYDIAPNKDKLKIILIKKFGAKDIRLEGNLFLALQTMDYREMEYKDKSREELNKMGILKVQGEAVHELFILLKDATCSNVFTNTTIEKVITDIYKSTISSLNLKSFQIKKLFIHPTDNRRVYEQVVIPDNTKVLDLPTWLQTTSWGIYNGHVGTFIQQVDNIANIFIYPEVKYKLNDSKHRSLEILAVGTGSVAASDITYKVTSSKVTILADIDTKVYDDNESNVVNQSAGILATDAEAIQKRSVKVTKDKVETNRDNYQYRQKDSSMEKWESRLISSWTRCHLCFLL